MTALDERTPAGGGRRGRSYRWGFRLLTALCDLGDGDHSLGEIARTMGVPATHALQVISAAVSEQWVERPRYGRYALHGPVASRALKYPAAASPLRAPQSPAARSEVKARLAGLQRRSNGLVILHGLLELVTPWHVHLACNDGAREHLRALIDDEHLPSFLPLGQGAGGHAMIPWLDPRLAVRVLDSPRRPGGALVEPLADSLDAIRDRGYAVTTGRGWTTLAAPLLGSVHVAGAVSATVPTGAVVIDPGHLLEAAESLQELLAQRSPFDG